MKVFPAAPWPGALKATSAIGTLLLAGVSWGAIRAIPPPATGFTHVFGIGVACLPPLLLVFSMLFTVHGYRLEHNALHVRRLLWSTRISLAGLRAVHSDPALLHCSKRIFGNGGLYAFTGLYASEKLGRYRLFATDVWHPVILQTATGTVVVTPAEPFAFVDAARRLVTTSPAPTGKSP